MQHQSVANLLRVLSVPKRLEIIDVLRQTKEGLPVTTIGSFVGLTDGMVSGHLTRMAQNGLVLKTPSGRYAFYALNRGLINQIFEHFRMEEFK